MPAMSDTSFARGVPAARPLHTPWAIWISVAPVVLVGTPAAVNAARYAFPLSPGGFGGATGVDGVPSTGGWAAGGVPAGVDAPGAVEGVPLTGGAALGAVEAEADGDAEVDPLGVGAEVGDESPHPVATSRTTATRTTRSYLKGELQTVARTRPLRSDRNRQGRGSSTAPQYPVDPSATTKPAIVPPDPTVANRRAFPRRQGKAQPSPAQFSRRTSSGRPPPATTSIARSASAVSATCWLNGP
jgi:hypothetical protein